MTLIITFFADEEETPNIIIIMQCYLNTLMLPLGILTGSNRVL